MKKIISLLLAVMMVLALTACSGSLDADSAAKLDAIAESLANIDAALAETEAAPAEEAAEEVTTVTPGVLTVATSPDFAPYEFYAIDENGDPVLAGFDVALAGYIAEHMGLELEIIPMDFDGVLAELANGTVDLGLAGLSPDPDREGAMDFSDIYYEGGQAFVCVSDNKDLFPTLADANNAEYSIGAQTASIQYDLAMENTPDADVVMLTKVTDIIAELISGKLDGAFIETAVAESYAKNYPELYIAHDVPYDVAGSAVGVSEGNAALLAAVNAAIADCIADGSMDAFVAEAGALAEGTIHEGLLDTFEG